MSEPLVIEAPFVSSRLPLVIALSAAGWIAAVTIPMLAVEDKIPWIPPEATQAVGTLLCFLPTLLAILGLVVALRLEARGGRATLYDDRVELTRGKSTVIVRLGEVRGFRDGCPGYIQLVPSASPARFWWSLTAIPTPDEDARTRVLAHLTRAGLSRLDG